MKVVKVKFADTVNSGSLNGGRYDGKQSSQKIYGGTMGGAIPRSSLFYFLSFEQQRSDGTAENHFTVPASGERGLRTQTGFVPVDSVEQWLLSVEKQVSAYYVFSASYVGRRGLYLTRFVAPNAGLVSTPVLLSPGAGGRLMTVISLPPTMPSSGRSRPQTDLGAYTIFQNSANSDYHSLQLSAESRLRRGLLYRIGYTWSHSIDEVSDPFDSRSFTSMPQNNTQLTLERTSSSFDVRHRLTWLLTWDVPKLASNRLLHNWRLAMMGEIQGGQPFTVNTSLDRNRDGLLTDRLDSIAGISFSPGDSQPVRINSGGSTLSMVAAQGNDGRLGRNTFRADGIANVDLALGRKFVLTESAALDLRVEAFNVFNHSQFGVPDRILESPGFGRCFDRLVGER